MTHFTAVSSLLRRCCVLLCRCCSAVGKRDSRLARQRSAPLSESSPSVNEEQLEREETWGGGTQSCTSWSQSKEAGMAAQLRQRAGGALVFISISLFFLLECFHFILSLLLLWNFYSSQSINYLHFLCVGYLRQSFFLRPFFAAFPLCFDFVLLTSPVCWL